MNTTFDINKIYELIDLYKYASVAGERVELIVTPYEVDGKWDDSKRLITIGLQGGFSRDRDTFLIDSSKEFDEKVLPQILAYFSSDSALGKWEVVLPEIKDGSVTCKGFAESEDGNVVYLESFDENIYENVKNNTTKVEEETTYKKEKLTDEEKIWEEIILYAKSRRVALDFYNSTNYTDEEKSILYQFAINLSEVKAISISNSRVYREKNEQVLEELFRDEEKLKEYGLPPELVKKVVDNSDIKVLARLAGAEKRIRRKVDFTNPEILSKVDFALTELTKVNYYELRNAGAVQFDEGMFKSNQVSAILKLKNTYETAVEMNNRDQYIKYCDEIYGMLEKKAKNNRKIVETHAETVDLKFEKYDDSVVDSYEKLDETLELVRYGKLDDERYEIIVEPYGENNEQRHVRISLLDGVSRNDTFNFVFTDGLEFDRQFNERLENIRREDPNFVTTVSLNIVPELGFVRHSLNESRDYNEILIRHANEEMAFPNAAKSIPQDDVPQATPSVDNDMLAQLKLLETQINDEARRQDEELQVQVVGNPDIQEKYNDSTVSFEKLHEYVQMYEIGNSKGYLQIFYRNGGREYTPVSEEEKRNIEFATYWAVGAGIDDDKDDLFIGEKYAFNDESKKLFNILDVQFRESVKRGIPVDMDSLKEAFDNSGVVNADKVYERLFKNPYYVEYVTGYYEKAIEKVQAEEQTEGFVPTDLDELQKGAHETAIVIDQQVVSEQIKESAPVEAERIKKLNELADVINAAAQAAEDIVQQDTLREIKESAPVEARQIMQANDQAMIEASAPVEAKNIQQKNDRIDAINAGAQAAQDIVQEETMSEIKECSPIEAARLLEQIRKAAEMEDQKVAAAPSEETEEPVEKEALFDIVEHSEETPEDPQLVEIRDAYEVVEGYASLEQPTSVKVFFDKENPNSAEVIISNGTGVDETVMYQRTFDKEKLTTTVIPLLCELYAKNNELTYNKSFDVPNTNKAGLVAVGTLEKTFQVSNADKELIALCQRTLEGELAKNVQVEEKMVK